MGVLLCECACVWKKKREEKERKFTSSYVEKQKERKEPSCYFSPQFWRKAKATGKRISSVLEALSLLPLSLAGLTFLFLESCSDGWAGEKDLGKRRPPKINRGENKTP